MLHFEAVYDHYTFSKGDKMGEAEFDIMWLSKWHNIFKDTTEQEQLFVR